MTWRIRHGRHEARRGKVRAAVARLVSGWVCSVWVWERGFPVQCVRGTMEPSWQRARREAERAMGV